MRANVFKVYNDMHNEGAVYAFHIAVQDNGLLRAIWLVYVAKSMHKHFENKLNCNRWIKS
jgi:hypothetical protein